jgi:hypothetical protein
VAMDADFFESLIAAVAEFIGEATHGAEAHGDNAAPTHWFTTLDHPSEKQISFAVPQHQGIQSVRESDPEFELSAFLLRVGEMFSAYHDALDKGDMQPVRRFVDEAAYAELEPTVCRIGRRAGGARLLKIRAIRAITARHDDGLDLIRVFITADQSGTDDILCEYWELIRKRGTLTQPGMSITKCPNCGGPVDGLDPTRCAYCGTRLADPALDWVVRKITPQ